MILEMAADGAVELRETLDFQHLHCEMALPQACIEEAREALAGIAELAPDGAWISLAWLHAAGIAEQPAPERAEWSARFARMVDKARPHGWVDAEGLAVKAHVVWAAPR